MNSSKKTLLSAHAPYSNTNFFIPNRFTHKHGETSSQRFQRETKEGQEELRQKLGPTGTVNSLKKIETATAKVSFDGKILSSIYKLGEKIFPNNSHLARLAGLEMQLAIREAYKSLYTQRGESFYAFMERQDKIVKKSGHQEISITKGKISIPRDQRNFQIFNAKSSLRTAAEQDRLKTTNNTKEKQQTARKKVETTTSGLTLPYGAHLTSIRIGTQKTLPLIPGTSGRYKINLGGRRSRTEARLKIHDIMTAPPGTIVQIGRTKCIWAPCPEVPGGTFVIMRRGKLPAFQNRRRKSIYHGNFIKFISPSLATKRKERQKQERGGFLVDRAPAHNLGVEKITKAESLNSIITRIFKDPNYKIYEHFDLTANEAQKLKTPKAQAAVLEYFRIFKVANNIDSNTDSLENINLYVVPPTEGQILRFKASLSKQARQNLTQLREKNRLSSFIKKYQEIAKNSPDRLRNELGKSLTDQFEIQHRLRLQATAPSRFRNAFDKIQGKTAVGEVLRRPPFNVKNELALRKTLYHLLRNVGTYKPSVKHILETFKVKGGGDKFIQEMEKHFQGLSKAKTNSPTYARHLAAIRQMENYIDQAKQLGRALQNMRYDTKNTFGPLIYKGVGPDSRQSYADKHRDTFDQATEIQNNKVPKGTEFHMLRELKLDKIQYQYSIGLDPSIATGIHKYIVSPTVKLNNQDLLHILMRYYGPEYLTNKNILKRVVSRTGQKTDKLVFTTPFKIAPALLNKMRALKNRNEIRSTAWERVSHKSLGTNDRLKRGLNIVFDSSEKGKRSQEVRIPFLVTDILCERSITADMYDTADGTRTLALNFKGKLRDLMRKALSTTTLAAAGDVIRKKCSYYDKEGNLQINKKKLRSMLNDYIELAITRLPLHNKLLRNEVDKVAQELKGKKYQDMNAKEKNIFVTAINIARKRLIRKFKFGRNMDTFGDDTAHETTRNQLMITGYAYKEAINKIKNQLPYSRTPKIEHLQKILIKEGYPVMAMRNIENVLKDKDSQLSGDKNGLTAKTIDLGKGFELRINGANFDQKTGQLQTNIVLYRNGAKLRALGPIRFTKADYGLDYKDLKKANFTYSIITNQVLINRGSASTPNILRIGKLGSTHERAALELGIDKKRSPKEIHILLESAKKITNKVHGKIFNMMLSRNASVARITEVMDAVASMNRIEFRVDRDGKVSINGTAGARIDLGKSGFYLAPKVSAGVNVDGTAPTLQAKIGGGWSKSAQINNHRVTFALFFNNTEIGTAFEWQASIPNSIWNTNTTVAASANLARLSATVGLSFGMNVSQEKLRNREYTKQIKALGWEKIVNAKSPTDRVNEMMKDQLRLRGLVSRMRSYGVKDAQISDFFQKNILPSLSDSAIHRYWTTGCPIAFDAWGIGASFSVNPISPWNLSQTSTSWTAGAFFRIRWSTGRTIVQRFAPPRTQMAEHLTNAELQRVVSRRFGSNFQLEGGQWETSAALIGSEKNREGAQVLTNKKSKQMSLNSIRSMNEYFTNKQIPLRVEYSKNNPGLLRLRMVDTNNTNIRLYLDPEMARTGLVLKNGQVYLSANRAKRLYFLSRTISYPFQKDGALHHRALIITDNPLRAQDILQTSDSWIYQKSGYNFRIVNKYRNKSQSNIMNTRKFQARQPLSLKERKAQIADVRIRLKKAQVALLKMNQTSRRARSLNAYIATMKSELDKSRHEANATFAAENLLNSNQRTFAKLRHKHLANKINTLRSGQFSEILKIAKEIIADSDFLGLNFKPKFKSAHYLATALQKQANAVDQYRPISDSDRLKEWNKTRRAFGVLDRKETSISPERMTALSKFAIDFFNSNSPKYKALRKKYERQYVESATMVHGQAHSSAADHHTLRILATIAKAAGIEPAPSTIELNYLKIRMNTESFTDIHPSHKWIKYLLRKAENNEINSMPKPYQNYYNRFVKPNYDALYAINPKMNYWSKAKTVSAIADRIRLGTQRKHFESNIRAIRHQIKKSFAASMNRLSLGNTVNGFTADQMAKYVWKMMGETDLTKKQTINNPRRGVRQVGSYRIRRIGNRVVAGTAVMGDPTGDNIHTYLNHQQFNPNEKDENGKPTIGSAIAKLLIERYTPTPKINMSAKETMRLPMAKKLATLPGFRYAFGSADFDQIRTISEMVRNGKTITMTGPMQHALNRFKLLLIRIRALQLRGAKTVRLSPNYRLALTDFSTGFGTYHRCGNSSENVDEGFALQQLVNVGGAKLWRRFQIGSQHDVQTNTFTIGAGGGSTITSQTTGHTGQVGQNRDGQPGTPVINKGGSKGKGGQTKRK